MYRKYTRLTSDDKCEYTTASGPPSILDGYRSCSLVASNDSTFVAWRSLPDVLSQWTGEKTVVKSLKTLLFTAVGLHDQAL